MAKCSGKTIEKAELVEMQFGSVWRYAWAVKFTDGSRAFFAGDGRGTGIQNPSIEAVQACDIFTLKEAGEMVIDNERKQEHNRQVRRAQDMAQYEKLKRDLGLED